jgi:hypothetical protein
LRKFFIALRKIKYILNAGLSCTNTGHTFFLSADNSVQYTAKSEVVPPGFDEHHSRAQTFLKELLLAEASEALKKLVCKESTHRAVKALLGRIFDGRLAGAAACGVFGL